MDSFAIEKVAENPQSGEIRLLVQGFLDAHTVSHFEQEMNNLMGREFSKITIDFSELDYISSAGIGALMNFTKLLRDKGGDLIIFEPTDKVYKIFDLLGFSMIFTIQKS